MFHLRTPFDSEAVDYLFGLKSSPAPAGEIKEMLRLPSPSEPLFDSFLTPAAAPRLLALYRGTGMRWRYFGHACILLETPEVNMLFDPVLSYTYESAVSRYTYMDLPDSIDYVVITHNHQDHVLFETLLQIRHKVKYIIIPSNSGGLLQDPSLRLILNNVGFKDVIELNHLESIEFEKGSITALPFLGEHSDLDIRSKSAYLVRAGNRSLLFAADSCNIEPRLYEHIQSEAGDVDALFLGHGVRRRPAQLALRPADHQEHGARHGRIAPPLGVELRPGLRPCEALQLQVRLRLCHGARAVAGLHHESEIYGPVPPHRRIEPPHTRVPREWHLRREAVWRERDIHR